MSTIGEVLSIISEEANRLEEKYREENEIHEDYYIWGVRRFEKILKSRLDEKRSSLE
jgi:hypothetical protein